MPPRPTLRPNGKRKMTLADKVRLEWARFDVWLESQRKDVDDRREKSLQELRQCMEATKRSLPKGFHPTLMKEYENEKYMIVNDREERAVLVMRSRVEWEERLQKAGLKAEDWDPMTLAEQEAVKAALAGDSDEDEEEYTTDNAVGAEQNTALPWNATNGHQPIIQEDVPAVAKRFAEAQRMKTLSPLPDLPEWLRTRTPNSVPPTPPETQNHKALAGVMSGERPLGMRYISPVLIEEDNGESLEDTDLVEFKLSIREQMIREFHKEAAELEIVLARKEHDIRLKADGVKALLTAHQLNMEDLRRKKEEKRKEIVDAERSRRDTEIRRQKVGPKGAAGMQRPPNVQMENTSFRKGLPQASGGYNTQFGRGTQMTNGAVLSHATEPPLKSAAVAEPMRTPVTGNSTLAPGTSKTETKKQKNGKSSKKASALRMKQPGPRNDSLSDKQPTEHPLGSGRSEKVPQVKQTRLKPTIEEVSDPEASSWVERPREVPKQQASRETDRFTESYFTPSPPQFESTIDDDVRNRFAQTAAHSQSMKQEKLSAANQRGLSDIEQLSEYQYFKNSGVEMKIDDVQESAGSAEEQHALWKPPVVFDDDSGEDCGGEELLYSLAFGGQGLDDNTSRALKTEAEPVWHQNANLVRPSQKKKAERKDSAKNINVPRKGELKTTSKSLSDALSSATEPEGFDNTAWETAMMQKFLGLAHTSL